MLRAFEYSVEQYPEKQCFSFTNASGSVTHFTYREVKQYALILVRNLREQGVVRGSFVAIDAANSPEYVVLILAAAYSGFSLIALNHRLTTEEKQKRLHALSSASGITPKVYLKQETLTSLLQGKPESSPFESPESDALLFDPSQVALVMFTSGTTGTAKAVPLTWRNLVGSSDAANAVMMHYGEGLWQATLPLFHVGGFQIVVRSLRNGTPFMLYERFDAQRVLEDAAQLQATHVSVVDKMLQDFLNLAESVSPTGDDQDRATLLSALQNYQFILLGGSAPNKKSLERSAALGLNLFASYGMTETSSQIAQALVVKSYNGGLHLLPSYEASIIEPDKEGFGQLAVRGPGVLSDYLNASAKRTEDGFFITGDTAALVGDTLYVKERTQDMFVSGGENVYPAEISAALVQVPGVSDAYVFGAPDETWGRRPVAFIEAAGLSNSKVASTNPHVFKQCAQKELAQHLSKLYMPKHLFVMDEFPRSGIGKTDRIALEKIYAQRLQVEQVKLYRVRLPFVTPVQTAKQTLTEREVLIVELVDTQGNKGLGECDSFTTPWYEPETLDQDEKVLRNVLIPGILNEMFLHPREVSTYLGTFSEAHNVPQAHAALEGAFWDLYGHLVEKPVWQLLQEELGNCSVASELCMDVLSPADSSSANSQNEKNTCEVYAGAVIGILDTKSTLKEIERCVSDGYKRVKLKVSPGNAFERVCAVREAFPDLLITLDANQSFTEDDIAELRALDSLKVAWVEEPCAGAEPGSWETLSRLQKSLKTPLCVDESMSDIADAYQVLGHTAIRTFALKIGRFGGVKPTLNFIKAAQEKGATLWMGGMYDTGISKRLHAAFQMLPCVKTPGDISATSRYFAHDITTPPYTVHRGTVTLNPEGYEAGLGCTLNEEALQQVVVAAYSFSRS